MEVGETIGNKATANVAIKQGLGPGDRVIVKGAGFLKEGDLVRVVAAPAIGEPNNPATADIQ